MKKTLIISLIAFCMCIRPTQAVIAADKISVATATLSGFQKQGPSLLDDRITRLTKYLESKDSPLAGSAAMFIHEADKYGLDWRLVAAIAGNESGFGHAIPSNSYNAWGWGIFTGKRDGIHFSTWNDGIATVSEGLKQHYVDRGLTTVDQIGRVYAADHTWAWKVNHFMEEIDAYTPADPEQLDVLL